jgi:mediator of RNA polymerase II transcription subunit 14
MLSFDLRTASFSYAVGFNASITYSPNSDSYECTFVRASPTNTPVTPSTGTGEASPHEMLAPLLSHKLNELTRSADVKKGTVGKEFISVCRLWPCVLYADHQLLRNTLPLLLEIEGIRAGSTTGYPKLVVSSVEEYRLVWDTDGSNRYVQLTILFSSDSADRQIRPHNPPNPKRPIPHHRYIHTRSRRSRRYIMRTPHSHTRPLDNHR